jgi:NO-binding membrane sensor protein with MHYT domain
MSVPFVSKEKVCQCGRKFPESAERCPACGMTLHRGTTTVHVFGLNATDVLRVARHIRFATRLSTVALIIGILAGVAAIVANMPRIIEMARSVLGWA